MFLKYTHNTILVTDVKDKAYKVLKVMLSQAPDWTKNFHVLVDALCSNRKRFNATYRTEMVTARVLRKLKAI